nr:AMP-binding protein [Nocardioides sp. TF02-7]
MAQRTVERPGAGGSPAEEWSEAISRWHRGWRVVQPPSVPSDAGPFDGVRGYRLGDITVVGCRVATCSGGRTADRHSDLHDGSEIGILVLHGGRERVTWGRRTLAVGPGEALVWDTRGDGRFQVDRFVDKTTIFVPRDVVASWGTRAESLVARDPVAAAATLPLRSVLRALDQTPGAVLESQSGAALASALKELTFLALGAAAPAGRSTAARLWPEITRIVEDRLPGPVTAEILARDLSVSVRTVYQAFADHGTTVRGPRARAPAGTCSGGVDRPASRRGRRDGGRPVEVPRPVVVRQGLPAAVRRDAGRGPPAGPFDVSHLTAEGESMGASMETYRETYQESMTDPERFWLAAARLLDWEQTPTRALDDTAAPFYRWFPDGRLNVCHNALDRHVEAGHGDRVALVHDSPVTGSTRTLTYAELRDRVARFAGVLRDLGVGPGDRVVVYLPMIPEAAVAMLACARLGAVHSVVFGGFAPPELAARIDDAEPTVVVSASCGIEGSRVIEYKPLLDQALALAEHRPERCVVLQRPEAPAAMGPPRRRLGRRRGRCAAGAVPAGCEHRPALHPLHLRDHREAQGCGA